MTTTVGWYHCKVKPISRSNGRTAVAAAAYRSGGLLHDNQLEKTYDYTRKRGVEASFIVAPDNAPEWVNNLGELWNQAQLKDNRVNSRMAREIELALPNTLTPGDREALVREFSEHLVDRYGVAVSAALHEPSWRGDNRNYHAHILMTTRRIDGNGFGAKTRELDDRVTGPEEVEHIREYAATLINEYLEDVGQDERVDHRSFKDRGIEMEPMEHLGVEASSMERRGEHSYLGDINRDILHERDVNEMKGELAVLEAEILLAETIQPLPQEIEIPEPEPSLLTWKEQKIAAQDVFNSPVAAQYENSIMEAGKVQEYGLEKSWFARSITMFENVYYGTMGYIKSAFDRVVNRDRSPAQDKDDFEPDK